MSSLFDTNILTWSAEQATLLRRLAAGERVNDQVDWEHVIDEIESVGRSDFHAFESLLMRAIAHRLKAMAWPDSREIPHWQAEARTLGLDARRKYQNSMRRYLDLEDIFPDAVSTLPATIDGVPPAALPVSCPFTLEELLVKP